MKPKGRTAFIIMPSVMLSGVSVGNLGWQGRLLSICSFVGFVGRGAQLGAKDGFSLCLHGVGA